MKKEVLLGSSLPFRRDVPKSATRAAPEGIDTIVAGTRVRIKKLFDGDGSIDEVESVPRRGQIKLKGKKGTFSPYALEIVSSDEES